jgi:hypothetical protein
MPWRDWQFWVVSVFAGWGLWIIVRPFLPKRSKGACSGCASGAAAQRPKRVNLRVKVDRSKAEGPADASARHSTSD